MSLNLLAALRLVSALCVAAAAGCSHPSPKLGDREAQVRWVREEAKPATAFVADLFQRHDVVLLGEHHLVAQNALFVAELVPVLDAAGVKVLVSEFARSKDNDVLRPLLRAQKFDQDRVVGVLRRLPNPLWGHREYLQILRAAWQVNSGRGSAGKPFEVIGFEYDFDQAKRLRRKNRKQAFEQTLAREKHMVETVDKLLAEGRKALVHVGYAHTILNHGQRLGTVLHRKFGKRVAQVGLHHDITPTLTKHLEQVVAEADQPKMPLGFRVVGSPFAKIRLPEGPFRRLRGSTYVDFAQSLVILAPVDRLRRTTWIQGFVEPDRFEDARVVAERMRFVKPGLETLAELESSLTERFAGQLARQLAGR